MKMQVEAKVLVAKTLFEIQEKINRYISEGWKLQGAVVPVEKDGVVSFLATMVLEV